MTVPRDNAVLGSGWKFLLLASVSLILVSPPAIADSWYEHYFKAEQALDSEEWIVAVEEINGALEQKGDSGARVRSYGMNVVAYFPYLKLGIAYYELDQFDAALQAFETELRLGAISQSDDASAELVRYRRLSQEAQQVAMAAEQTQIRQIVADSVSNAGMLESQGLMSEAMAALDRALAVAPDDEDAKAAMSDFRPRYVDWQRAQQLNEQVAQLIADGRVHLDAQRFGEASSLFRQAIFLKPSVEIQTLLDEAQERLQAELQAGRGPQDQPTNLDATLDNVRQEVARARQENIERLLSESESKFDAGFAEESLSAANQVLALDPGNTTALSHIGRAYAVISQQLLGTGPTENIPPAVRFVDLRSEDGDGGLVETTTSPEFRLNGVIIDNSPVDVVFHGNEGGTVDAVFNSQPLGDFYLTEFSVESSLSPGITTFRLVATDSQNLTSSSEYAVFYAQPVLRAPWFYALMLGAILAFVGLQLWRRAQRLARLRHRKFNPYVAGAPILEEEMFFGRRELVDRILQTIHNNSLLIYGERRIGKTSIQHQVMKRLRELDDPTYEFHPVYVDLQGTPETSFFQTIAEDIFHELAPVLDGLTPGKDLAGDYSYRDFVRDIHAVLKSLRGRTNKKVKVVLLIDEVDVLNEYDPRINQQLRSLFMKSFAENLAAVVSGVEIKKRWEREGSPWYNFFEEIEVAPLEPQDALELIRNPIRGIFKLDRGAEEKIISMTGGKPYLIQKVCISLVTRLHEQNRRRITVADVDAVGRVTS